MPGPSLKPSPSPCPSLDPNHSHPSPSPSPSPNQASKKESKRRVVTNAAGQLVVVAAEISDTLIAAELDAPASAPADAPGGGA